MNDEELKEMLKLYTKKDLWEFNQIKAKKQIELMAQIKEQDQKIKELQLQLAEKNELFIATKWRADDLEKQLSEKEKEYKFKLKEMDNEYKKEFKIFEEDCKHLYKTETKKAIEELEQLKHDIWTNQHDDGWLDEQVDIYELTEMIDQQIAELKGEKWYGKKMGQS